MALSCGLTSVKGNRGENTKKKKNNKNNSYYSIQGKETDWIALIEKVVRLKTRLIGMFV
jgi:hypothetical protein